MFKRLKFILFCLLLPGTFLSAGFFDKMFSDNKEKPVTIKVLIADNIDRCMLEVRGAYNIIDPRDGKRVSTRFVGKTNYLETASDGLKWGEGFPSIYQLEIVTKNGSVPIIVDGIQYLGRMQIYQIDNKISIVNEIDVDEYLKSILDPLFERDLPREAANAVAITARTDAYSLIARAPKSHWQVKSEAVGYYGEGVTDVDNNIEEAVDNTRYFVLENNKKSLGERFLFTRFTENCAGKTAPFNTVFRKENSSGYEGVESFFASNNRSATFWEYEMSKDKLLELLKIDDIKSIKVYREPFANKVYSVKVKSDYGDRDFTFVEWQKLLGRGNLLSSEFEIDETSDGYRFFGYGKGPGVGLCVYSAEQMANSGSDAASILKHFFPTMNIIKVTGKDFYS